MLNFSEKGSKLIVIFILTVIVSGSILTYLSITNISNYRELLEKKVTEEERDLTTRFASNFQVKLRSLTSEFSDFMLNNDSLIENLKNLNNINELINYVVTDSNNSFLHPYFFNSNFSTIKSKPSQTYLNRLQSAQNSEFIAKDFKNAITIYLRTLKVAKTKSDSVQVYNSMARLYVKMNVQQKAFDTYEIILTRFSSIVNPSGFPYVYFSIIKLLEINNPSNFEQLEKLLLIFLNGMDDGIIPLNDSTLEILDLISEWQQEYPNTSNKTLFKDLIEQSRNSLSLINNYKFTIENILKEKKGDSNKDQRGEFLKINPTNRNTDELMFFFNLQPYSVGFVIGLDPLFKAVLQNQQLSSFKFEYDVKLIKKPDNIYQSSSSLVTITEFSSDFEDNMIQVTLKNKKIIDEAVFKRKLTYGIGLFLFLGIMVLGLYILIRDVNREKRLNKLRADFVSNVTHELKTPLTSIYMFAESILIGRAKSEADLKKYANIIVKESENLKRMIFNILEFSRKENNKLNFKISKNNLSDIVNTTMDEMNYWLEISNFNVTIEVGQNIHANVEIEGLKQALSNLISNAIKYSTTTKKLIVRLYKNNNRIFIEIEDFGIGIEKNKFDLIFEKFYRVKSVENESVSGTGLGLTVTRDIIEAQNGKIMVESKLGVGTKFTIIFKLT